jgi:hypothetical protein
LARVFANCEGITSGIRPNDSQRAGLGFVAQAFLVAVRLHSLAAFVLGDFCFSSFLQGSHIELIRNPKFESGVDPTIEIESAQLSFLSSIDNQTSSSGARLQM